MVAGQLGGNYGNSRQSGSGDDAGVNCFFLGTDRHIIEKGLITKEEFMVKLSAERAVYREMLEKMR